MLTGLIVPVVVFVLARVFVELVARNSPPGGGVNFGAIFAAFLAFLASIGYGLFDTIYGIVLLVQSRE